MAIKFNVSAVPCQVRLSVVTLGPEGTITRVFDNSSEFDSYLEASLKLLDLDELFAVYTSEIICDTNIYMKEDHCDI